jgi:hypothetical protein
MTSASGGRQGRRAGAERLDLLEQFSCDGRLGVEGDKSLQLALRLVEQAGASVGESERQV